MASWVGNEYEMNVIDKGQNMIEGMRKYRMGEGRGAIMTRQMLQGVLYHTEQATWWSETVCGTNATFQCWPSFSNLKFDHI